MIEKPTVFVPGDDQQTALPKSGTADGFVSGLDESFATIHVGEGMLRGAILVVIGDVVARLDENVR